MSTMSETETLVSSSAITTRCPSPRVVVVDQRDGDRGRPHGLHRTTLTPLRV